MNPFYIPRNRYNSRPGIRVYPTQMETQSLGRLRVRCVTAGEIPIPNASITITPPNQPTQVLEEITTDASGLSPEVELATPPFDYSQQPSEPQPFANYDVRVTAPNFENMVYNGVEVFPDVTAEQNSVLVPSEQTPEGTAVFNIDANTLYGIYPPKIPESEIKPVNETGEIVLNRVVVPEYVIVHDGVPSSTAQNYYVRFRDYIKNVASSEIYSTWPENTIYANVLAILSFTLNRVYTEWYRNQGYNFTITSSTAFDHKWTRGRNIFENISQIVDSVFVNYVSRPGVRQPLLTQYCDGARVQCPQWLSQWGSKTLGDQGRTAIQILRNYYGNDVFINTATEVAGVPSSWPGANLSIGSSGDNVRVIQQQLNRIAQVYTAIPTLVVDGQYGPRTANAVRAFQKIFSLPVTGVVDRATWYKISQIFVAISRLAELN